MPPIHLQTEEGHDVELSPADYAALRSWPRLDLSRLVVVGEDAVHARRTDGTVHPQSLEDLLSLVRVPAPLAVAEPSQDAPAVPADPAPPVTSQDDRNALAAKYPRDSLIGHFLRTGDARPSRRALAGEATARRLPSVLIHGRPVLLKGRTVEAGRVRVPVTAKDSRDVAAWAWVSLAAHDALRSSPLKPDTLAWMLDSEGQPTARVNAGQGDIRRQRVADLLGELGMGADVVEVVALEPAAC